MHSFVEGHDVPGWSVGLDVMAGRDDVSSAISEEPEILRDFLTDIVR